MNYVSQVMGKLHDHRVQVRQPKKPTVHKPLIEEIASSSKVSSGLKIHDKNDIDKKQSEPQYIILHKPEGNKVNELIGYFKLPSRVRFWYTVVQRNILRLSIIYSAIQFLASYQRHQSRCRRRPHNRRGSTDELSRGRFCTLYFGSG